MTRSRQRRVKGIDPYDSDASDISETSFSNLQSSFSRAALQGHGALYQYARNDNVEELNRMLTDPEELKRVNELNNEGVSALHLAARFNHLQVVKLLIVYGKADPKVRDHEGATPLHFCARKRQQGDDPKETKNLMGIIQFLVDCSDVNAKDNYGSTALHFAAVRGNIVAARELLKCKKTLINVKDYLGCTPLHDAATYGHEQVATLLLERGAGLFYKDKDKCNALHCASYEGNYKIVQLLVDKCDDKKRKEFVNTKDDEDIQAIHYAVEAKCVNSVRILIENGAQVNEPCRKKTTGRAPMHLAAIEDVPAIAQLLRENGANMVPRDIDLATPLHLAADYECLDMIKWLLTEIHAPIDSTDIDHYTPLLNAACNSSQKVVKSLVEEGASLKETEKSEQNVIHLAAFWKQLKVLKYLLKNVRGTDNSYLINALDRYGNTPLHLGARVGDIDVVKALLNSDADLFSKNEDEETPTIVASKLGYHDIVELFLEKDEKVLNDEDEESNTALHAAAERGHLQVVELLCNYGADKLNRNIKYRVPLDLAAMNGHLPIVRYFLEEDMPPEPADKETETPLQLACSNGHARVASLLIESGADPKKKNSKGKCCLSTAIEKGHRGVVEEILTSSNWKQAITAECNPDHPFQRMTPLRLLIAKMPDMAPLALNRSIRVGPEVSTLETDKEYYIEFNLEMIDDTYVDYSTPHCSIFDENISDDECLPPEYAKPYTKDQNYIKTNHPLTYMVKNKQSNLLNHPAVLALIRQKWSTGRLFYFIFLLYYACFLSFVTIFMVESTPPYFLNGDDNLNDTLCDPMINSSDVIDVMQVLVFIFAGIGIIIEVFQLFSTSWIYLTEPVNFVDWFCYLTAILFVVDTNDCGSREDWQWQLGAFTVLGVWLNFLLFFRRFPALGIYVVMVTEIFRTFSKIFVIFFLFIIAFGLSFHMLLQNQAPFEEPFDSIMKTWVQMLGEIEFTGMFFDDDAPPAYREVTYVVFIIFLVLLAIILSNLLVGLAVDDVNQLRIDAGRVKLGMQIDLALDVELALPNALRRYFECNRRRVIIQPNFKNSRIKRVAQSVSSVLEGPLLAENTIIESFKSLDEEQVPTLNAVQESLSTRIKENQREITSVKTQLDRIEGMLIHLCGGKPGKPGQKLSKKRTLTNLLSIVEPDERTEADA